jgi:hypothetical protein
VTLRGSFYVEHADEALQLVRNVEKAEHDQHPLHRIMAVRRGGSTSNEPRGTAISAYSPASLV